MKGPPYAPFPPPSADTAVEVVADARSFDRVWSAIQAQAHHGGLEIRTKVRRAEGRWRLADLRLARGRQRAGHWLLREVGQLRRAAIVIDDLGQDLVAARRLLALPYPLTCSILPHLQYSTATAEEAQRAGCEVMLHLPMQPLPNAGARPGEGEVRVGMTGPEVERVLEGDLASVPYARGANNHMGSRATADPVLMAAVMNVLAKRRLYFIDSRTTRASVALQMARRRGVPAFYRSVFLDDVPNVEYTLRQLREFLRVIEKQDAAVAIGHPYPTTIAAMVRFLPELERHDIQLVPASQLLELPEVAGLSPPGPISP